MIKEPKKFKYTIDNQTWHNVEVWTATRGGNKSPVTTYYRYNNRWITPYERRAKNIPDPDINWCLTNFYDDSCLTELVYSENPLFKLVAKEDGFKGVYFPIPGIKSL